MIDGWPSHYSGGRVFSYLEVDVLVSSDDVKLVYPNAEADRMLAVDYPVALDVLNDVLCGAVEDESSDTLLGVVWDDGLTVHLPAWFSQVDTVVDDDNGLLLFDFRPVYNDVNKVLTLKEHVRPGSTVSVDGVHGFTTLPEALKMMLVGVMLMVDSGFTGDDRVQSKSIEDVSVNYGSVDYDVAGLVRKRYRHTVSKWSLCDTGFVSMPRKLPDFPYWM